MLVFPEAYVPGLYTMRIGVSSMSERDSENGPVSLSGEPSSHRSVQIPQAPPQ